MKRGKRRRSIIGYKQSLILTVKRILRIHVRRYRVGLQRSLLGILSDIYYRIYYYDVIVSGSVLIISKIRV